MRRLITSRTVGSLARTLWEIFLRVGTVTYVACCLFFPLFFLPPFLAGAFDGHPGLKIAIAFVSLSLFLAIRLLNSWLFFARLRRHYPEVFERIAGKESWWVLNDNPFGGVQKLNRVAVTVAKTPVFPLTLRRHARATRYLDLLVLVAAILLVLIGLWVAI
jgi:hypothetical protein